MNTPADQPPIRSGSRRIAYLVLGLLFVALGGLGAFLPVLPTTPFLLLASACFVRSSPTLHRWLLRSRLFGPLLRDWQQHRGVRLHVKLTAVTVLVAVVAASITFGNLPRPLLLALIALALIGLVVVLRLPVINGAGMRSKPENQSASELVVPGEEAGVQKEYPTHS